MSKADSGGEQKPEGYYYARGTVHRIATEKWHQPRQKRVIDYWYRPTGEDVIGDMVKNGWDGAVAKEAVKALWLDQMNSLPTYDDAP